MKLTDKAEEILETLWIELVEKKKEKCDATLVKRDEALYELIRGGHARVTNDKIALTVKGTEAARQCIRRHRLAERLMVDVLDLKKGLVHETSCNFEHFLHKGIDENICTLLGHPKTCPHGRPIPEGRCCKEARKQVAKLIVPLSELEVNRSAVIAYLHTHDREALRKLIAMGALPQTEVVLLQRFPTVLFQLGKSQFAVDDELASHIFVRRQ